MLKQFWAIFICVYYLIIPLSISKWWENIDQWNYKRHIISYSQTSKYEGKYYYHSKSVNKINYIFRYIQQT